MNLPQSKAQELMDIIKKDLAKWAVKMRVEDQGHTITASGKKNTDGYPIYDVVLDFTIQVLFLGFDHDLYGKLTFTIQEKKDSENYWVYRGTGTIENMKEDNDMSNTETFGSSTSDLSAFFLSLADELNI